jgi:uncharacterized membrane protein YedE/YeeE
MSEVPLNQDLGRRVGKVLGAEIEGGPQIEGFYLGWGFRSEDEDLGCRFQNLDLWGCIFGIGLRVGSGCSVGNRVAVEGAWFRVYGLGFTAWVQGTGHRVERRGFRG